jgi:hypothetical protein
VAKTASNRTIRVALLLPDKVADFIVRAQVIHDTMAANTGTLPSPSPVLTTLASHISDLASKEAVAKTRTVGAVADRDAAKKVVADDLNNECAYVEQLVNANPTNGALIAQDAGMTLRKVPSRNKPDLAANKGAVSGSVHAVAKATKGAKANEWQYSLDGGKTWIDAPTTTKAETTIQSLTPGTTVSIRQRALTKAGLPDWGQPVSTVVT